MCLSTTAPGGVLPNQQNLGDAHGHGDELRAVSRRHLYSCNVGLSVTALGSSVSLRQSTSGGVMLCDAKSTDTFVGFRLGMRMYAYTRNVLGGDGRYMNTVSSE